MPHLTVDYSAPLTGTFDSRALGRDLHRITEKAVGAQVAGCKTVLRPIQDGVIADGDEDVDMVHVDVAIHAGRTREAKAELAAGVLALLKERLAAGPGRRLHLSAHVSELDPATYVSHKLQASA
ncbi:isomerase [Streptomyces sp. P38-E01]|uniref:Isomerase n=1 Tax=Streptomyces tardus TaxID=2780544 RepID=A0A949JQI6_9ACTN|nr:isomerase [Streptomyces tardus]MBU7599401.1 isomerase [Streptomyces tardus]